MNNLEIPFEAIILGVPVACLILVIAFELVDRIKKFKHFDNFKKDLWWRLQFKADLGSTGRIMRAICLFIKNRI